MVKKKPGDNPPDPLTDTGKIRRDMMIKNSMSRSYLMAIVSMSLVAVAGVIAIVSLRPESDLVIVMATVFGFTAPTTLSLLAFLKAQETHLSVNSRLDDLIKNASRVARETGIREGMVLADERTDKLAAAK